MFNLLLSRCCLTLTINRNLVTNHFLHFLSLDRSDPKKFQILQLIAALLGWNDGKHLLSVNSNHYILIFMFS